MTIGRSGAQRTHDGWRTVATSYALQCGYEPLIRSVGRVNATELDRLRNRFLLTADTRDVLAARDSVKQLLGIRQLDTSPSR